MFRKYSNDPKKEKSKSKFWKRKIPPALSNAIFLLKQDTKYTIRY